MNELKILFIGDIFGKAGKEAVFRLLPELKSERQLDMVVANGENIAGGVGITKNLARKLFYYGVDVITLGNHAYKRRDDIADFLDEQQNIIRPANYPPGNYGHGSVIFETENGVKIGVLNLMGRVFMPIEDCPFRVGEEHIKRLEEECKVILVDFHAEATSEKRTMGFFLDGRVSAVIGTHTHIQTADEQILPGGTAYITDAGMTGPHRSSIGVKTKLALQHLIQGIAVRFEPASEDIRLQGVFLKINSDSGKALSIERVDKQLSE